ncbi:hypothetical protein CKM354_001189800 [Cercospora kikuchii]|uniref:F-box domain-containing protein n=1 Tax=Cercospora kikuchii TaxID=84275 RepID=A0A9P3FL76_9PEZI|nr:uncharacterized protein CKM354_001189800 [Cercospora kikuchii]GIZ48854.1 hypothetical protein CKM354_001189800 [Cercospora kikuchii]
MTTAVEAILATAELLEAIFLQLEPKMRLTLQRVNKTWKSAIEACPTLQEALSLRPIPVKMLLNVPVFLCWDHKTTRSFVLGFIDPPTFERNPFVRGSSMYATQFPKISQPGIKASWCDMLVSQPPPSHVFMSYGKLCEEYLPGHPGTVVANAEGVRISQIFDEWEVPRRMHDENDGEGDVSYPASG